MARLVPGMTERNSRDMSIKRGMILAMSLAKISSLLAILFAALALSACDRCGNPIRALNGDLTMACKGDEVSPR